MKTARIISKIYGSDTFEDEGEGILINCLEKRHDKGFYEVRLLSDMSKTCCRWVNDCDIKEVNNEGD